MKAVQATFVQDSDNYAVQFKDGSFDHMQPKSEISLEKYMKLVMKNFPHYDFTTVQDTVVVIEDDYDPSITNPETGEIIEDIIVIGNYTINFDKAIVYDKLRDETVDLPCITDDEDSRPRLIEFYELQTEADERLHKIINNQKEQEMKTEAQQQTAEPTAQTTVEQPTVAKPTVISRAGRGLAVGTEFGVKCVTRPTITTLLFAADILLQTANAVSYMEAVAIKPLGNHPDATRQELREQSLKACSGALDTVYAVPKTVITMVKSVSIINKLKAAQPAIA